MKSKLEDIIIEPDNPFANCKLERNKYAHPLREIVKSYSDGMLLYAKTKENVFDDAQITHRDGYTLYIRTLDLNTNFEVIKKRLESFVK